MTTLQAKEVVLNYANIEGNNNKYYKLTIEQVGSMYEVVAEYGRVGKKPQVKRYQAYSELTAEKLFEQKKREKIRKGYLEVALLKEQEVKQTVTAERTKVEVKRTALQQEKYERIQRFIRNIRKEAKMYVENNVNLPLGAISPKRIEEARKVLERLKDETNTQQQLMYSNEFYRMIPIMFRGRKEDMILNNGDKIVAMYDLLAIMETVANKATLQMTEHEKVLEEMGIDLQVLSRRTKKYREIKERVESSHAPNHNYKVYVQDIYEVQKDEWDNRFNPYKVATQELYHGSLVENYTNILTNGLKIKPQGVRLTGSMFGNGIYFADKATKSASYSLGNFRGKGNGTYYMLICEVATGKEYKTEHAKPHYNKAPKGYNSVKGVMGSQLRNNEYIVYAENQVKIKYIIEMKVR